MKSNNITPGQSPDISNQSIAPLQFQFHGANAPSRTSRSIVFFYIFLLNRHLCNNIQIKEKGLVPSVNKIIPILKNPMRNQKFFFPLSNLG